MNHVQVPIRFVVRMAGWRLYWWTSVPSSERFITHSSHAMNRILRSDHKIFAFKLKVTASLKMFVEKHSNICFTITWWLLIHTLKPVVGSISLMDDCDESSINTLKWRTTFEVREQYNFNEEVQYHINKLPI